MRHHLQTLTRAWVYDVQVCQANGDVVITNDGATILNRMTVTQPAAKMLVELSKSQACPWLSPFQFT